MSDDVSEADPGPREVSVSIWKAYTALGRRVRIEFDTEEWEYAGETHPAQHFLLVTSVNDWRRFVDAVEEVVTDLVHEIAAEN